MHVIKLLFIFSCVSNSLFGASTPESILVDLKNGLDARDFDTVYSMLSLETVAYYDNMLQIARTGKKKDVRMLGYIVLLNEENYGRHYGGDTDALYSDHGRRGDHRNILLGLIPVGAADVSKVVREDAFVFCPSSYNISHRFWGTSAFIVDHPNFKHKESAHYLSSESSGEMISIDSISPSVTSFKLNGRKLAP